MLTRSISPLSMRALASTTLHWANSNDAPPRDPFRTGSCCPSRSSTHCGRNRGFETSCGDLACRTGLHPQKSPRIAETALSERCGTMRRRVIRSV